MALNLDQQITPPTPPNLGAADVAYDQGFFTQSFGGLNTYFSKLAALFSALFGRRGGKWINSPYGGFQDSTDQTAANTTTAYAVTFDTTDFSNGVTLSNSSRLNVTTNDGQDVDVWFRKNGTNIDNSNSRFHAVARKSSGDPSHLIASLNFFVSLAANDYVEIMWRPTDIGVSLEHFAASSTPTRPAIPSVIATLSFVSNLSVETA